MIDEEFLREELDCAEMLGLTLEEYHKELEDTRPYYLRDDYKEDDNKDRLHEVLDYLGLTENDLLE